LPDGLFSNQKSQFGKICEGLATEDFGTVYGHLVYFTSSWSILLPLGIFCGHLTYVMVIWNIFPVFGTLYQEKSGNPVNCPTQSFYFQVGL
jgi:hypothetical protein